MSEATCIVRAVLAQGGPFSPVVFSLSTKGQRHPTTFIWPSYDRPSLPCPVSQRCSSATLIDISST